MKKTLKNCPLHGHGANGLGCYCEINNKDYVTIATELLGDSEYGANAFEIIVDLLIEQDKLRANLKEAQDERKG